jgi:hypothetical protein
MATHGFEVLITVDQNLRHQQNLQTVGFAVYSPLVLGSPLSVHVGRREINAMADTQVALDPSGEIRVSLSPDDFAVAERVGAQRTEEARQARRPGRAGCPPDNLEQDIDGAAAEIAFARVLGVPPVLSVSPDPGPDVAGFLVRSTSLSNGHLIIRPGEAKDNRYVLLVGEGTDWRVIGTICGRDGVRPEFWRPPDARPGCYMVPQSQLVRLQQQPSKIAVPRGDLAARNERI